jgi:uridylate kinase
MTFKRTGSRIKDDRKGRKRVVIKLTGGIFGFDASSTILKAYAAMLDDIAGEVQPIVIAGGGKVARHYIRLARELGSDEASLDIMGIAVSRLNAELLVAALGEKAHTSVPQDLEQVAAAASSGRIVICGGLHPGQSTNATSALIAEKVHALKFLNATDVDGIYDSDPNTNPNAKLFSEITIRQCLEILQNGSSTAGTYDLMDLVALKVIERSKLDTFVLRSTPENIRKAVIGKPFVGTRIVPDGR